MNIGMNTIMGHSYTGISAARPPLATDQGEILIGLDDMDEEQLAGFFSSIRKMAKTVVRKTAGAISAKNIMAGVDIVSAASRGDVKALGKIAYSAVAAKSRNKRKRRRGRKARRVLRVANRMVAKARRPRRRRRRFTSRRKRAVKKVQLKLLKRLQKRKATGQRYRGSLYAKGLRAGICP